MYTPILRNRQSEILAIKRLSQKTKDLCMPLLDLAAPSKEADIKQQQAYTERNIKRMGEASQGFHFVLIDSSELDPNLRIDGGKHPLLEAARTITKIKSIPIPVAGIHRDDAHMKAVIRAREEMSGGLVCFRLDATDIGTATRSSEMLKELFLKHSIKQSEVILFLDMQSVFGLNSDALALHISHFINRLSNKNWKGIIVAGYGIPDSIPKAVHVRDQGYIPRVEQEVFFRVLKDYSQNNIWFGDYTSLSPAHIEIDWKIIRKIMGPKAIYALKDSWFVTRGAPFESDPDGWKQYYSLAAKIVSLEEFPKDPNYSFGDFYIYERRSRSGTKAGSPASWITACVNHHITLTAEIHNAL
jgi:hypothetical protein